MAKNEQSPAIGEEIGRKLSVKELGWSKAAIQKAVLNDQNAEVFLARFVGLATGTKEFRNQEGEVGFGLIGNFEGTSADGEQKAGTVLYLPGYVQDQIVSVLHSNEDVGVQIGVDVYAHYEEDAATSYVFTARNLIKIENPALEAVKAQVSSLPMPPKALPAPKA